MTASVSYSIFSLCIFIGFSWDVEGAVPYNIGIKFAQIINSCTNPTRRVLCQAFYERKRLCLLSFLKRNPLRRFAPPLPKGEASMFAQTKRGKFFAKLSAKESGKKSFPDWKGLNFMFVFILLRGRPSCDKFLERRRVLQDTQ